jgi:hypothetical protein
MIFDLSKTHISLGDQRYDQEGEGLFVYPKDDLSAFTEPFRLEVLHSRPLNVEPGEVIRVPVHVIDCEPLYIPVLVLSSETVNDGFELRGLITKEYVTEAHRCKFQKSPQQVGVKRK